jgi:hypothetical protein
MICGPTAVRTWEWSSSKSMSRTQRRRSSMLHWPQMMAASWPGVAGVTLSEVTA